MRIKMDIQRVYVPFKFQDKFDLDFKKIYSLKYTLNPKGKKVLFVSDNLCKEAYKQGCVLTEYGQTVWENLLKIVNHYTPNIKECLLIPFNQASSRGMSDGGRGDYYLHCEKNIDLIIQKYQPDLVFYLDTFLQKRHIKIGQIQKEDSITYIRSISLYGLTDRVQYEPSLAYCCGYVIKQLVTYLSGIDFVYSTPKQIYVDDTSKIKKFFRALNESKTPCIDTETVNLYRVSNRLLTIQVMTDKDTVWFIPYQHKDSPFNGKQLDLINQGFKDWCERGRSKYTIYHNAKFDLEQIKNISHYQWYNHLIYDTIAGEFCLEENRKLLKGMSILKPYSLGQLSLEYGSDAYNTGDITKDDRGNMESFSLKQIMEYGVKDVIVPYFIARYQQQIAKAFQSPNFFDCVTKQLGRMIYVMSEMEYLGTYVDKKHILKQIAKGSIFGTVSENVNKMLQTSKNAQKANVLKLKKLGMPTDGGIFGGSPSWVLDLGKEFDKDALYFKVMKLPVLEYNAKGMGKTDKEFLTQYAEVEEVKVLQEFRRVSKLKSAYINATYQRFKTDDDLRLDGRLRCSYGFSGVVTGRAACSNPNMQQVPSHAKDENSKLMVGAIRRQFICTPSKHSFVQFHADYSAQEVRDWGNVSQDPSIAAPFKHSLDLSNQLRVNDFKGKDNKELLERFEVEGDVHKLNYKFFYGRYPKTSEERQSVKQVVFGVIYGKGPHSLSLDIKGTVQQAKDLIKLMFTKFKKGGEWIKKIQYVASKTCLAKYPNGRIRHLWGYLYDDESITSSMDRKGPNSVIQGHASDINFIGGYLLKKMCWKYFGSKGINLGIHHCNVVHDSIEAEAPLANLPIALYLVEHCYTTLVHTYMRKVWDFRFLVNLVMEFDIGWSGNNAEKWDFTKDGFLKLVQDALKGKKEELGQTYTKEQYEKMLHNFEVLRKCRYKEIKDSLGGDYASETFYFDQYVDDLQVENVTDIV